MTDTADLKHEYSAKKLSLEPKAIAASYRLDAALKTLQKFSSASVDIPDPVIDEVIRSERLLIFYENELLKVEAQLKEIL